jgi:hypothetical protein
MEEDTCGRAATHAGAITVQEKEFLHVEGTSRRRSRHKQVTRWGDKLGFAEKCLSPLGKECGKFAD